MIVAGLGKPEALRASRRDGILQLRSEVDPTPRAPARELLRAAGHADCPAGGAPEVEVPMSTARRATSFEAATGPGPRSVIRSRSAFLSRPRSRFPAPYPSPHPSSHPFAYPFAYPSPRLIRSLALSLCAFLLLVCAPASAVANVAPESALLIHVQPVAEGCATPITHCSDIVRSTTEAGTLEFVIFFTRVYSWGGEELELFEVHADLTWPETWVWIGGEQCGAGDLLPANGRSLPLDLYWWDCPLLPEAPLAVFPVARLIFEVNGPGRLDFANPSSNPVLLGCWEENFVTYAVGVDAEAGMDCEYTLMRCAGNEACTPRFDSPQLELTAPPGAAAWGEVGVTAVSFTQGACELLVTALDGWAWGEVVPNHPDDPHGRLRVRADATGLTPGVYRTRMQVAAPLTRIARCLPVVLTVQESTAAPEPGRVETRVASWGKVKTLYR